MYYRRKGNQWVLTDAIRSDKAMVYEFIQAHPGAAARAIRAGAGVRNERVQIILAVGVKAGELVMAGGRYRSRLYELTELGLEAMNAPPEPKW